MCEGCYEDAGSPKVVTEKTIAVANLIAKVAKFTSYAGGNGHVVLNNWNLDDDVIQLSLGWVAQNKSEVSLEQLAAEKECLEALSALSLDERYSAMAIEEGLLTAPGVAAKKLSTLEAQIFERLAVTGSGVIGDSDRSKDMFQSLADRGYVTLAKGRSGPLGVFTGEQVASLTESGREALKRFTEKKTDATPLHSSPNF